MLAGIHSLGCRGAGGIGSNFTMDIQCSPSTAGQSSLLPASKPLPALPLQMAVELCPRGTEQKGQSCQECDINFYSFNGTSCFACPEGERVACEGVPREVGAWQEAS